MNDLESLAVQVEGLSGPSREVDCRIWLQVGNELGFDDPEHKWKLHRPLQPRICVMGRWMGSALEKYPDDIAGVARNWNVPLLTASLDAAMTLIEGDYWAIRVLPPEPCWAYCGDRAQPSTGIAATPALALVAASLRARHAMEARS